MMRSAISVSNPSLSIGGVPTLPPPCPPLPRNFHPYRSSRSSNITCKSFGQEILPLLSSSHDLLFAAIAKIETAAPGGIDPTPPADSSWQFWSAGVLGSAVVTFFRNQLWDLTKLKKNVDSMVEKAEDVAEVVEKVAEQVEQVAENMAESLPEGGKLQQAARSLDRAAEIAGKDARMAREIIDKVQEMEKETEETIDMVREKTAQMKKEKQPTVD